MQFSSENYLRYIIKKRTPIILASFVITILIVMYLHLYQWNTYVVKVSFFITSTEQVDPDQILGKNYIDISVNQSELQRVQSFGQSIDLLKYLIENYDFDKRFKMNKEDNFERKILMKVLANSYQLTLSRYNEIVITVKDQDPEFALNLARGVMIGINNLNNKFLESFKANKISICEKQIEFLEKSKLEIQSEASRMRSNIRAEKRKIMSVTQIDNGATNYQSNTRNMHRYLDSEYKNLKDSSKMAFLRMFDEYSKLKEVSLEDEFRRKIDLSEIDYLEDALSVSMEKIRSLNKTLVYHNNLLIKDALSLELIRAKKPYVTREEIPLGENNYNRYIVATTIAFLYSLLSCLVISGLILRYKGVFKLPEDQKNESAEN